MEQFYELQTWKSSYPITRAATSMPKFWVVDNIVFIDAWFKAHQKVREAK